MIPLKDTIPSRSFPILNWTLIFANLVIFLFESSLGPAQLDRLIFNYGLIPARFDLGSAGSLLTLLTSMFLHGGWFHLLSNLWALYIFGDNVEDRMGSGRYLIFYLVTGILAGLTQVYFNPNQNVPGVGASGAIAGVLAAYLILFPTSRVITLLPFFFFFSFVEIPAVLYLGIWFITQFYSGLFSLGSAASAGGIAYWAHIGGFVSGLVLVLIFARRPPSHYRTYYPDEFHPW